MKTYNLLPGDCRAVMKTLADESVDSVVTDPPYNLTSARPGGRSPATEGAVMKGFMGLRWDGSGIAFDPEVWAECLRVLKPGGHLLAFGAPRTYHRMACVIEDVGFEIRDSIEWVYGSGFPKSLNVSKAIGDDTGNEWEGWGTALKPAHEPIVLARKPLCGTVAENILKYRTGALNINGARVPSSSGELGRWPANLIHDGSEEALGVFPRAPGQFAKSSTAAGNKTLNVYSGRKRESSGAEPRNEDEMSASRFFYCAKASRADREDGCEQLPVKSAGELTGRKDGSAGLSSPRAGAGRSSKNDRANTHPTVKPTALMRYLCRLITPRGGTVLDPFMGSGSTGRGAVLEGMCFIGIELTPEYLPVAEARIGSCKNEDDGV